MKAVGKKRTKAARKVKRLPFTSRKEQEARKKFEEFWSDPCWTEPLTQETPCSGSC